MLGLTQSLLDGFSLAAWDASFERDQPVLSAHLLAEDLIMQADPQAEIMQVVTLVRQGLHDAQAAAVSGADYQAALTVLDSFVVNKLAGLTP